MLFASRRARPLMQCEVLHTLPGRIRIGARALRYLGDQSEDIRQRLLGLQAVREVAVGTVTGNVLLHYEAALVSPEELCEAVEAALAPYALPALVAEREERLRPTVQERRLQEESVTELLGRVLINVASLGFALLRPAAPALTILGRFTTMPALTALSLAWPLLKSGFTALREHGRPNADTLSSTAVLASLLAGKDLSALTVVLLADVAELLTAYTMDRTRRAIREMLAVGEEHAWRVDEQGQERRVPLEQITAGDEVVVHTGEKFGVDGVVVQGTGTVDEASITGEFMPATKALGAQVFAGTVVKRGQLRVRAESVGDDTAVARIVHMVEDATQHKADIQAFADRFSAALIPLNFALAGLVYAVTRSPARALNMLIIDYSCGARLSTATALSAAISTAARNSILIKGGNYIEQLDRADTLILDKTGTLTEGQPHVTSLYPVPGVTKRRLLEIAAAAEETSSHPMALAVLSKLRRSGGRIPEHHDSETVVARGVSTRLTSGPLVRVGSRRYLEECGLSTTAGAEAVARLARAGESILYVAQDEELVGVLGVQDELRENMKKSLNRLRLAGMDDIILLTGDVEQHAEVIANRMAMDSYQAELLPEDKAATVLRLQSRGVKVVMVGDGINDAPALAYADVGIAMGHTRTDVAMEAADVTITGDDPLMIPATIRLAKKTMGIVRQNFGLTIGVNSLALMLASLGVLPVIWGAVIHNLTTVMLVLNSGRLLLHDVHDGR